MRGAGAGAGGTGQGTSGASCSAVHGMRAEVTSSIWKRQ